MGMFSKLMTKVLDTATIAAPPPAAPGPQASTPAAPAASSPKTATPAPAAAAASAPPVQVDVAAVLDGFAAKNREKLNWRKSIVDLMKLVGIDSSLSARKELAAELHYPGDKSDSAKMNVWLHREVLKKLADNGGKVPADLLD